MISIMTANPKSMIHMFLKTVSSARNEMSSRIIAETASIFWENVRKEKTILINLNYYSNGLN